MVGSEHLGREPALRLEIELAELPEEPTLALALRLQGSAPSLPGRRKASSTTITSITATIMKIVS